MVRIRERQEGSIYIEALVAVAILAIAIIPLLGAFLVTPAAQRQALEQTAATNIARSRLEALHSLTGDEWDALSDSTELEPLDGVEYRVTLSVDAPRGENLRDARVTVEWTDAKGNPAQISLATSVARRP